MPNTVSKHFSKINEKLNAKKKSARPRREDNSVKISNRLEAQSLWMMEKITWKRRPMRMWPKILLKTRWFTNHLALLVRVKFREETRNHKIFKVSFCHLDFTWNQLWWILKIGNWDFFDENGKFYLLLSVNAQYGKVLKTLPSKKFHEINSLVSSLV